MRNVDMDINITQSSVNADLSVERVVDKNHAALKHLDYDSSGHTGFQRAGNYVEKEEGKGLSTNDFTDSFKTDVNNNTSARHTHSNKSVLDDISSSDISNWNAKQSAISGSNKVSSDYVDDTGHTNKFVTSSEKSQIATNASAITAIKDGVSIDSFGDVETALSSIKDGVSIDSFGDVETALTGKVDTSKVKNEASTTAGDVYDVRYINSMLGDIESLLGGI